MRMSPTQSLVTCLRHKYFQFSGRAQRSEFWWFYLFSVTLFIVLGVAGTFLFEQLFTLDGTINISTVFLFVLVGLAFLAILIPHVTVSIRRFHDAGLSGWWFIGLSLVSFIWLIPGLEWLEWIDWVTSILILLITLKIGTKGTNRYGPDPLETNSAHVFE